MASSSTCAASLSSLSSSYLDVLVRHPFPTRRSSDLYGEFSRFQPGAGTSMGFDDLKTIEAYLYLRSILEDKQYRSEEHTSELQSRGHLVCRLLLEKKKHLITPA